MMMAYAETMQEGPAPPATMVPTSIEAVQEGATPLTTTAPATVNRQVRAGDTELFN